MRIVLDTNVLLSGVATRGICEAALDACLASSEHTIVLSEHILSEFARHYAGKFGMPADMTRLVVAFLRGQAERVEPAKVTEGSCRDADDLPVLGTVVAANADCLVTGDADLLSLREFSGHLILSPRQLYERLA